ncbi:MAG: biosynthetic peptidoglycan transglycosylase [Pseudomonadota bacterium]
MNYLAPFLPQLFDSLMQFLKIALIVSVVILLVLLAYCAALYVKLPSVQPLVFTNSEPRQNLLQFDDIPLVSVNAILAAEDKNFFSHNGIDYPAILRAMKLMGESGKPVSGASTITMQLAKHSLLGRDRSLARKLSQFMLAAKIESRLSKEQILQRYLSSIYFGENTYGIDAAAQFYFKKALAELTLAEAAMLAGLPKAPSKYNPTASPAASLERRNWVLERMLENQFIERLQFEKARATSV